MKRLAACLLALVTVCGAAGLALANDGVDLATVHVIVRSASLPVVDARVVLDLNLNGVWDEGLNEPVAWTDATGLAMFGDIVGVGQPAPGGGADPADWQASRILAGNLRGTVGARDARLDFVLPPGASRANLALHDVRGRRLAATGGDGDLVLDLPDGLPAGVYFVRLSAGASAPVSLRITSIGERTRTVRAVRVSAAEAVAAGWVEPRASAAAAKDDDPSQLVWVLVDHPDHDPAIVPTVLVPGYNQIDIDLAVFLQPPVLLVAEPYLGRLIGSGLGNTRTFDIAPGQPLNFSWAANASHPGGTIVSYRWGWNLADPDDPADPGWAVPPGLEPENRRIPDDTTFLTGVHQLIIEAVDNLGRRSRWTLTLSVVAIPDPWDQLPVLLVDDVNDRASNAWTSAAGLPLDRDEYRDAFWRGILQGPGGVVGWDPDAHSTDCELELLAFRDAVAYRSLVWFTRFASTGNNVAGQFRPDFAMNALSDIDKYVWLTQYQRFAGNVLYAGSQALISHLALAPYETPIVFESTEALYSGGMTVVQGQQVRRGFGVRFEPDGSETLVGLTRYPYEVMGIALLDIVTRNDFYEYGNGLSLGSRRKAGCAGLKGLVLDPAFRDAHLPGGAVADTIWTHAAIDWRDPQHLDDPYLLGRQWSWGNDEFYDANTVGRPTPYTLQQCADGPCVEPMFRSIARYDWVRQVRLDADPQDDWPAGYYGGEDQPSLAQHCGTNALQAGLTSARTNDRVVGFVAHKTAAVKPNQVADVVLGFDPYRFDHQEMTKVIRWVLGQHFGLAMNPGI